MARGRTITTFGQAFDPFGISHGSLVIVIPFYSINAGTQLSGVFSDWQRQVLRVNPDGTIDYSPWAVNTWQMPKMFVADFEELRLQQGATLTSLETNDIDNRNTAKTYTTVTLESVVNGGHRGLEAVNVNVRFRVKII